MRSPSPLPDSLVGRPFRVDEAALVPIPRSRTRRGDLASPLWGVRSPPTTSFWPALRAAGCVIAPDEAFSHLTAARMMGLPLPQPWEPEEPWHITGENELPRLRRRHVVSHRSVDLRGVVIVDGLRCTDPLTTWADLAGIVALDDLVVMGDAIVELGDGIAISDLRRVVSARARHRGVVRMREAVDLVRVGSRSPMESRTRLVFLPRRPAGARAECARARRGRGVARLRRLRLAREEGGRRVRRRLPPHRSSAMAARRGPTRVRSGSRLDLRTAHGAVGDGPGPSRSPDPSTPPAPPVT